MDALKPCPFCGHEAPAIECVGKAHWRVYCPACEASGGSSFVKDKAITAWETRTPAPSAPVEAEPVAWAELAKAVVDLVEGLDGYGTQVSAMNGVRLKDQPAWVRFYNAVRGRHVAEPARTEEYEHIRATALGVMKRHAMSGDPEIALHIADALTGAPSAKDAGSATAPTPPAVERLVEAAREIVEIIDGAVQENHAAAQALEMDSFTCQPLREALATFQEVGR